MTFVIITDREQRRETPQLRFKRHLLGPGRFKARASSGALKYGSYDEVGQPEEQSDSTFVRPNSQKVKLDFNFLYNFSKLPQL